MEECAQEPLLNELENILPAEFAARSKRLGIVNAMMTRNLPRRSKQQDAKKLIVAGVTNDVCTIYPVLSLLQDGFELQVVADAGGGRLPQWAMAWPFGGWSALAQR